MSPTQGALIEDEHYWIHLTGTPVSFWQVAYRLPEPGHYCCEADDCRQWEANGTLFRDDEVDQWIHIPYPTSTSQAAPIHQGLEPIHDA